MKLSRFRIRSPQPVFALLAVLGSVGTIHASNPILTATPSSFTLYCSATNPGYPVTVTLKAISAAVGTTHIPRRLPATGITGVTVAPVSSSATAITSAMSTTSGVSYTFTPAAGCAAAASGTYTFLAAPTTTGTKVADASVTVSIVNTSFLTTATPTITLNCSNPSTLTPVAVVVKAANAIPSTTTDTLTPGLASTTPTLFSVAAAANSASNITQANSAASVGITYNFTPAASCTANSQPFSSQTYTFKAATTAVRPELTWR
jgi:hypothetical protein